MIESHTSATRRSSQWLLLSLASTAFLGSGCSNLVNTASSGALVATTGKIGGRVHGGNQPVSGATVNLYFAGQDGLGVSSRLVATTTTADDGAGSFSFVRAADGGTNAGTTNTFSCPVGPGSPLVYVVARGGNTLNTHDATRNAASVFIAPYGLCGSLSATSFVSMSEAVTAATVAAIHQYMNVTTGNIGADGINVAYDGLANSFRLVSNMVNLSTGQTTASTVIRGDAALVTVTATPEQAKINQVANILSACVNTPTGPAGGSGTANACDILFANAVPPTDPGTTSTPTVTFSAPTDVLQAAYYMFTNATNSTPAHLTALYNLAPAAGAPYQPTLTNVPSDWSVGIKYSASGSCAAGSVSFLTNPYDLNIDANGNVWIANNQRGGSALSELSSTGAPVACVPIGGASLGGTIDSVGNIWAADSENNVLYRYSPTGGTPAVQFPTPAAPYAVAADGSGNIFFSTLSATNGVYEILGAASATTAVAPVAISTDVGSTPARILVDDHGAIWASTGSTFVSLISPATTGATLMNGYITTHVTTSGPTYGVAVTNSLNTVNRLFTSDQGTANLIDQVMGSGSTYTPAQNFPTPAGAAGLNLPSAVAVDGAHNIWAANSGAGTQTSGTSTTNSGVVSEISVSGVSLSPNANGSQSTGGYQKDLTSFLRGRSIAVDQSGNVWIGNDGSSAITEIVGGGVPIYQPFAAGLLNNRFQTIP